jgi:glycosyltransferase involved in cell wall biosynthesis
MRQKQGSLSEGSPYGPCPKVSVLLPNRNHGRFLSEAISSVLEQDFAEFELIVSDNASTDGSASIIREFARRDARVRFVVHENDLGMAANLNWCLAEARGEYVKFLLADDKLVRPDALGRLVSILDRDKGIVLASSSAQIINEQSQFQYVRDYIGHDLVEDGQPACRRCLLRGRNEIGEPSLFLFRRHYAGNGFNPSYRLWVDLEFACRVLEQGRFAYSLEPLAAFRVHEGQETRRLLRENLLSTEYYRLLADFADRSWLGRKAARERLFEEFYRCSKRAGPTQEAQVALAAALDRLGRQGYAAFKFRRKVLRPFSKLYRSLFKRLRPDRATYLPR